MAEHSKKPEVSTVVSSLERKLRGLRRNILGITEVGRNADSSDESFGNFSAHFDSANQDWLEFRKVWDELDSAHLSSNPNEEFPNATWSQMYDQVRDEIRNADGILRTIKILRDKANTVAVKDTPATCPSGQVQRYLPKISIPKFSGDLEKWTHFRDTFVSVIHDDTRLPRVDKLHHLIGALEGEPASLISGLPVDGNSYQQAWDTLMQTYDNPRVLATRHIHRIINFQVKDCKTEYSKYKEFLAQVGESIESFRLLTLTSQADAILSILALRALDPQTRRQFELYCNANDFPTPDDVIDFVRQRMMACKMASDPILHSSATTVQSNSNQRRPPFRHSPKYKSNVFALHTQPPTGRQSFRGTPQTSFTSQQPSSRSFMKPRSPSKVPTHPASPPGPCPFCKGSHSLARCFSFSELPTKGRIEFTNAWTGCLNCLSIGHKAAKCPSHWSCKYCKARHHSLLHSAGEPAPTTSAQSSSSFAAHAQSNCNSSWSSQSILGTAQVRIEGSHRSVSALAILDCGSHHTIITYEVANRLGAALRPFDSHLTGLGETSVNNVRGWTTCRLKPTHGPETFKVRVVVVDKISAGLPNLRLTPALMTKISQFPLADPNFGEPHHVDALIGGDIFPRLITGIPQKIGDDELYKIPTVLGDIIMGEISGIVSFNGLVLLAQGEPAIDEQLRAFRELEEPISADRRNPSDVRCEEQFMSTHSRTSEGSYVVRLPIKPNCDSPGTNRVVALRRYYALERKLHRDPLLKEKYCEFMRDYIRLEHMSPAAAPSAYVIPHHGIWQKKPNELKLRVVFDASCPATRCSLNETLDWGPRLQTDICDVLTCFRLYVIALTADIVKMYRQVLVHPDDRHLQHIFWREDPSEAVTEYELNTVTYGIVSSAYHALRVIDQVIDDEGQHFPLATQCLKKKSRYVDDFATGANSLEEAQELKRQLTDMLARGGFELSKWASNVPALVDDPSALKQPSMVPQPDESTIKILGLLWRPSTDDFAFFVQEPIRIATKRILLSSIARIFDPLGFLAPIIFHAKTIMREIWKYKLTWDEMLPLEIQSAWLAFLDELHLLSDISIPRYVHAHNAEINLVGFCDASSLGYAAAVYLQSTTSDGNIYTHLIKSKTKVAPTKFLTIAQLELCGALLLQRVMSTIPIVSNKKPLYYTDSSVVLAWLSTPTHCQKVFEANRVAAILSQSQTSQWRFVRSKDNPADVASRGCLPSRLIADDLWWKGPEWFRDGSTPSDVHLTRGHLTEEVSQAMLVDSSPSTVVFDCSWMSRFSSFHRLVRVTARMLRFTACLKKAQDVPIGPITASEYDHALMTCVRLVQHSNFSSLLSSHNIPKVYQQLQPFVDEAGFIRVGGRLRHALLPHDMKHPLLLPKTHYFTNLVLDNIHTMHFHAGPTLTLSLLRNRFWIPSALKLIKSRIYRCRDCRIRMTRPLNPRMGDLPPDRLQPCKAFTNVGIDYAGPLAIKESSRRNAATRKAYICVFVCLASKAVHIELVTSLSTDAFLATLDRFVGRRGLPNTIHSDNATNFLGASRFLKDLYTFIRSNSTVWIDHLSSKGIEWKFIPPRSPHFGGLWEAAVKSIKGLLVKSVGKQPLTYEELATLLIRIEGILNSRPLCPLRDDSESFDTLTPGHFLIGTPLTSIPNESDLHPDSSPSSVSRWHQVQSHVTHLWSRWTKEYLHHLQQRNKWTENHPNLAIGDLVLLREKHTPTGTWPVARICEVYPGNDDVVRVVAVRTPANKIFKRSTATLVPLFLPNCDKEQS